jgi:hypothetical protein
MTLAAVTQDAPAVLIVSATELSGHAGKLLRHLAAGVIVRIDNLQLGETVGWLSPDPPASVAGLDLVAPGTARDAL